MPIPVRNLGQYGILKDSSAVDLPINAFTDGRNVIFIDGLVTPSPTLRDFTSTVSIDPAEGSGEMAPQFMVGVYPDTGFDSVVLATQDFRLKSLQNGVYTDTTPSGWAPSDGQHQFTSTVFADQLYINRDTHVPLYFSKATSLWTTLPGWDSSWRCRSLRGFKDFLIAINVSKGANQYPNMFKWSAQTFNGTAPSSWDPTDLSLLAGENFIKNTTGILVDGALLRNDFILYTTEDCHVLSYTGDTNVFTNNRLFTKAGVLGPNCVVEWDGLHYCFGNKDIFVHDGFKKQSILQGKLKDWLYKRLDLSKAERCFAMHMQDINCIGFFYSDVTDEVAFPKTEYCNVGLLYNYVDSNWTILDCPNVSSGGLINADTVITWAEATAKSYDWSKMGGTWSDQENTTVRHASWLSVGNGGTIPNTKVLITDSVLRPKVPLPEVTGLETPCFVERSLINGATFKAGMDERNVVNRVWPLMVTPNSAETIYVYFDGAATLAGAPVGRKEYAFNPLKDYKVDSRVTNRFMRIGFRFPSRVPVGLAGYDLDFRPISHR